MYNWNLISIHWINEWRIYLVKRNSQKRKMLLKLCCCIFTTMFYKEFILNHLSKMFNGFWSTQNKKIHIPSYNIQGISQPGSIHHPTCTNNLNPHRDNGQVRNIPPHLASIALLKLLLPSFTYLLPSHQYLLTPIQSLSAQISLLSKNVSNTLPCWN